MIGNLNPLTFLLMLRVGAGLFLKGPSKGIFSETLDFLEAAGIQNAPFDILTPYPGTP